MIDSHAYINLFIDFYNYVCNCHLPEKHFLKLLYK